ncbi:membrane anchor in succinate dehydrogenase complex [Hanseniaspora vineae]
MLAQITKRHLTKVIKTTHSLSYPLTKLPSTTLPIQRHYTTSTPPDEDLLSRIKITPVKRVNETRDTKVARLVYQSRKRGILETDILLSGFASKYLKRFSDIELEEYDQLLNELDWDIYYWATKNYAVTKLPKRWEGSKVLELLQEYSENKEREILRVPEVNEY